MEAILLRTKLYIPPRRPELISRPRLIERLNAGLHNKLTLVSAPAGFGKTTLLSEWVASCGRPVAWVSLDEGDNDPARFLAYLIAGVQAVQADVGEAFLAALQSPQPPPIESLLTGLINEISTRYSPQDDHEGRAFILILDDYHHITTQAIHDGLTFLLDHLPPQMHLVIATRADPPLATARLRGGGHLIDLRVADLRFTPDEAATFLNDVMRLGLSPEDLAVLGGRTEGWIAGLQMAAISMQGRKQEGDLTAFIEAFGGTNRFILDYLMEEVLNQQAPAIQDFLMETSVLERMCGALCDAVRLQGAKTPGDSIEADASPPSGEGVSRDSQAILAYLERTNLFVMPLDDERRWYRYHHLFADLLKSTLGQRRPAEEIRELHRRASRWHQGEGSPEEAMVHTMAARDFERAALMIEENIVSMLSRSEVPVLLGWIEKLPQEIVRGRPWIDVFRANALALTGRLDEVDFLLEGAEKKIEPAAPQAPELLGHIAAVRAYSANLRGDAARAIEMATLTRRYLPEEHVAARGMAAYALADTCFAGDDLDGASQALLEMLSVGEKTGHLMMIIPALCELATIKKVQGRLHQAHELYGKARQWLVERNGLDSRLRCPYEFGLADLLFEWNQLDAAYEHAMTGNEYRRRLGGYWVVGDLPTMRILQARGDVEASLAVLRDAEQIVQTHYFQMTTLTEFRASRVNQWLAVGDLEMASHWAEVCSGSEQEQIALARLRLAQGRASDAQGLLDRQRTLAEVGGRTGRLIEILGLLALALEAQGRSGEADATLTQALSHARPEGYVRLFLNLGWPLCDLLKRLAEGGTTAKAHVAVIGNYVRDLLDAFQQEREAHRRRVAEAASMPPALATLAETSPDSLTERELDVLRLLAEGLSNKEIADRLVVAPSTIKQHLKNIYGKLDVHSRTQAVVRGRELELV